MKKISSIAFISALLWSLASSSAWECQAPEAQFFGIQEPLTWTIQGNFNQVNDHTLEVHEKAKAVSEGMLSLDKSNLNFPVRISARGAFRYEECPMRPFNLELLDKNLKGQFPFLKHFNKLKLVTLCYDQQEYREEETRKLFKEYTVYKLTNHFKGPHVQVQLMDLTLINNDGKIYYKGPGFLRESDKAFGERCGLEERGPTIQKWDNETRTMSRQLLLKDRTLKPYLYVYDKDAYLRMEFINRFLGNIDYHPEIDHNIIPLISKDPSDLREFVIPYDFDLSQAAGGTFYSFVTTPLQVAEGVKTWLLNEQNIAPEMAPAMAAELVAALPGMKAEIANSPLDAKGKKDLTDWVNAFELVFK